MIPSVIQALLVRAKHYNLLKMSLSSFSVAKTYHIQRCQCSDYTISDCYTLHRQTSLTCLHPGPRGWVLSGRRAAGRGVRHQGDLGGGGVLPHRDAQPGPGQEEGCGEEASTRLAAVWMCKDDLPQLLLHHGDQTQYRGRAATHHHLGHLHYILQWCGVGGPSGVWGIAGGWGGSGNVTEKWSQ